MAQLLIEVTPFNSILKESKEKPGVYEVEGIMQRAVSKNQNGRTYSKAILERESEKYIEEFVKNGNAFGELTERFYRVDEDRSRSSGGTGLGLSIVKNIMLQHQGQLEISSELNNGSTFKLIFPKDRIVRPS